VPLRTGNTYVIPGKGVVNTKKKTFSGKGPAPSGSRKVKAPTIATIPVVTTSPTGHVSTQNFSSPRAVSQAKRQARSSQRRVRRIEAQQASALGFHRRTQQRASEASTSGPPKLIERNGKKFISFDPNSPEARATKRYFEKGMTTTPSAPKRPAIPATFKGAKTAGTPSLKELQAADKQGKIRLNKRGYATTPAVRKVSSSLKRAQKVVRRSQPSLKGLSPSERSVVPLARKAHRKYPDVPRSVLMSDIRQESNFDPAAVSSAGAEGLSQFIPSTAASYGVKYGTGRREQQSQVTGQAHYLHDLGFAKDPQAALSSYSGGYAASDYNNPVLEGAADYRALDKTGNPKALRRLAQAQAKARKLGLNVSGASQVGPAPPKVVTRFKAIKAAAGALTKRHIPYVWGGGHGSIESAPTGLDCSGAVSWVLNKAGILKTPLTSGSMGEVLKPGPGAVTVFYNAGHTFMKIGNEYWGTSVGDSGAGGLGPHPAPSASYLAQYSVGHVPGLGKKQALQLGLSPTASESFPGMTLSASGTTATVDSSATATRDKPGFSKSPIRLTPNQKAHRTLKKLAQLGAGLSEKPSEGSESKASILAGLERKYGKAAV
jgi:soluble lytic murein transglycosylase-like protein